MHTRESWSPRGLVCTAVAPIRPAHPSRNSTMQLRHCQTLSKLFCDALSKSHLVIWLPPWTVQIYHGTVLPNSQREKRSWDQAQVRRRSSARIFSNSHSRLRRSGAIASLEQRTNTIQNIPKHLIRWALRSDGTCEGAHVDDTGSFVKC